MFKDLGLFEFLKEKVIKMRSEFDHREDEIINNDLMMKTLKFKNSKEVNSYFNAMRNGISYLLEGTGIMEEIRKDDIERRAAEYEAAGERRMGA